MTALGATIFARVQRSRKIRQPPTGRVVSRARPRRFGQEQQETLAADLRVPTLERSILRSGVRSPHGPEGGHKHCLRVREGGAGLDTGDSDGRTNLTRF
jgi:hypothetical protein